MPTRQAKTETEHGPGRVAAFTVRLTAAEATALHELRVALGAELDQRIPSRSEAVGALALAAAADPKVRAAVRRQLTGTPTRAAS